jgi:hypothetical protein
MHFWLIDKRAAVPRPHCKTKQQKTATGTTKLEPKAATLWDEIEFFFTHY